MTFDLSRAPDSFREIADVIGTEKTFQLIGQLPRCKTKKQTHVILYVPKKIKSDHALAKIIGVELATKLVEAFGGEILYPPICHDHYLTFRNKAVIDMVKRGASQKAVAWSFDMSDRQVRNILKKATSERDPEIPQEEP
ncbi:Mor transcription activator family protein [Aeromonas caviae]|uniref:Mor transcription activator family protein n=1 Tax=Aeromonas TaxID=642 RepID=UPI00244CCA94|nr:Mor transcription activator family protein [Aeromonas caviae]MDH0238101.1 hypothetical protein [Aeromonas caviae]